MGVGEGDGCGTRAVGDYGCRTSRIERGDDTSTVTELPPTMLPTGAGGAP